MKAVEANLLKFLQQPKQFVIPIYQRSYSWETANCQQLWRDILRVGRDASASGHFIGSVVYIAKGIYVTSSVPQLLVIDGQQRLTTLTLLLACLGSAIEKRQPDLGISRKKLENYYLFNAEEEGDLHFKLLLTRADKETLTRLVQGKEPPESGASPRVVANHRFFAEQIEKLSDKDLEALWEGLQKLVIVDISLDRDHDNPQLIFESLNATALKLTESDLIRNYVLMCLEPKEQAELYQEHWLPIEQGVGNSSEFDLFVRDYLTVRTGNIPNLRDIYATFKAFVQSSRAATGAELVDKRDELPDVAAPSSVPEIVADMHRFARYYVRFTQEGKESDPDLHAAFRDLRTLEVTVARPFLLRLYAQHDAGVIGKQEFAEVMRTIESFVFRRAVCGVPTNALNKLFASIHREITADNFVTSFQAALLLKDSYRRFPDDEEFKREIVVKDVYNFRTRNYLLGKLENYNRKEPVSVEGYTIEHILPQTPNLRPEWRKALGDDWKEVQQRLLHTLGNLTLTGYNSEYGDRPFAEKRDIEGGFRHSPLRLNQGLGQLDTWGAAQIEDRAARLAAQAASLWAYPSLSEAELSVYRQGGSATDDGGNYTLADHANYLNGEMLDLFHNLSKRVLNLDSSVRMEVKKLYIAFKSVTNFVDVVPQKRRLRLSLNLRFDEVDDPKQLCRDITNLGRWGNGDVEVGLDSVAQMDDVMYLIRQALQKQIDYEDGSASTSAD